MSDAHTRPRLSVQARPAGAASRTSQKVRKKLLPDEPVGVRQDPLQPEGTHNTDEERNKAMNELLISKRSAKGASTQTGDGGGTGKGDGND